MITIKNYECMNLKELKFMKSVYDDIQNDTVNTAELKKAYNKIFTGSATEDQMKETIIRWYYYEYDTKLTIAKMVNVNVKTIKQIKKHLGV
jgi:hypothetical protein